MKIIVSFFVIVFYTVSLSAQQNTILIIADDLGTDYCGFYENYADTAGLPNLRKLLSKGVRFTNAMSNPVCSPTRSGILTGRYSFRTGVGDAVGGTGSATLDTSHKTIPRLLKTYNPLINTANIGKWHLHLQTPASNLQIPNLMGYDYYAGNFLGALTSYTNWIKVTNGVSGTSTTYATTETANNAIDWIKSQNSNPFFLWLAFNAPHTPLHLPPTNLHSYTSLSGTNTDINANPKLYFKASLEALDHEIGRLFDTLVKINKMDSTNIIFIGDNGNGIRSAQNTNTSRAKGTIYQYGTHIPFIISGPAVYNPGRVDTTLINTVDLFSTIVEMFNYSNWQAEIPIDKPIDSKSMLPILKNQIGAIRPWAFTEIFKVVTDSADGKTMRNNEFKLLKFDNGKEEFYNLLSDPNELSNLLLGTLNSTELVNYNYLCSEMTNLIGNANYCSSTVGINEIKNNMKLILYPNPFSNFIKLDSSLKNNKFELINIDGEVIYKGNDIEKQNFSNLPNGIYFFRDLNNLQITTKLVKQSY